MRNDSLYLALAALGLGPDDGSPVFYALGVFLEERCPMAEDLRELGLFFLPARR